MNPNITVITLDRIMVFSYRLIAYFTGVFFCQLLACRKKKSKRKEKKKHKEGSNEGIEQKKCSRQYCICAGCKLKT